MVEVAPNQTIDPCKIAEFASYYGTSP